MAEKDLPGKQKKTRSFIGGGEEMHDDFFEWYYANHPGNGNTKQIIRRKETL